MIEREDEVDFLELHLIAVKLEKLWLAVDLVLDLERLSAVLLVVAGGEVAENAFAVAVGGQLEGCWIRAVWSWLEQRRWQQLVELAWQRLDEILDDRNLEHSSFHRQ